MIKRIRHSADSIRDSLTVLGLALGACLMFAGCTGKEAPVDNSAMLPENERVSNVPWNKPQGWENQGALGALGNDPRLGNGNH